MLKRLMTVVALTLMLVVAAKPIRIVQGVMMTPAEVEMMNANSASDHDGKSGNGFVRVLKAPFQAIGRLFGAGKKNDNKLERLSEKDVKKFETAGTVRVVDATTAITPEAAGIRTN